MYVYVCRLQAYVIGKTCGGIPSVSWVVYHHHGLMTISFISWVYHTIPRSLGMRQLSAPVVRSGGSPRAPCACGPDTHHDHVHITASSGLSVLVGAGEMSRRRLIFSLKPAVVQISEVWQLGCARWWQSLSTYSLGPDCHWSEAICESKLNIQVGLDYIWPHLQSPYHRDIILSIYHIISTAELIHW